MAARRSYRGGRNVALTNARTGGLLGIETKFLDVAFSNVAITGTSTDGSGGEIQPTSGCTGCFSAPAQGDTSSSREGKKIVIKSALVQGSIFIEKQAAQSTADNIPDLFICIVQDTQTNGVTVNSEDVFKNIVGASIGSTQPFRNMSNTSRFKVLKQWKWNRQVSLPITNDTGATGGVIQEGISIPFDISWKGVMPVNFTVGSTTADVANVVDNSLHLIAFASDASFVPLIYAGSRIRFVG